MKLHELHEAAKITKKTIEDVLGWYADEHFVREFNCSSRGITSLEGGPVKVTVDFSCSHNKLTDLKFGPVHVGVNYHCDYNSLTSLVGAPKIVGRDFNLNMNLLTSLEGCPAFIGGGLYTFNNKLTTLKGAPKMVGGDFSCNSNLLTSLEHCPAHIGETFSVEYNKLTSLEGIHKHIKFIGEGAIFTENLIKSHVLGLLLIDGLKYISLDNKQVTDIINKYLEGSRDVFDCQNELMDAGLDEYAQL
jgi:hypothetical protein